MSDSLLIEALKLMPDVCTAEIWSNEEKLKEHLFPIVGQGWAPLRIAMNPELVNELGGNRNLKGIAECIESIQVWSNSQKLFEGWDGVEVGTISNKVVLPTKFIESFINPGDCYVAKDW